MLTTPRPQGMKVVFLDFWGVMNETSEERKAWKATQGIRTTDLDPRRGALIENLCERTGAVIVISSDAVKEWEPGTHDFPGAKQMLTRIGISEHRITGWTYQDALSNTMFTRPAEIRAWLEQHPEVASYVIFDDKPLPFTDELVSGCVERLEGGRTPEAAQLIEAMLDADPEMAARFVQVSQKHLTAGDVERGLSILGMGRP